MSETQPNVYETCDPTYLQQLRGQVGMDVVQLARIACLSVAQVKSLEAGADDLFYSQAIKRQAYKRILMILGAPPPAAYAASDEDDVAPSVLVAPVNESLNHIADLTTQPVDDWNSAVGAGVGIGRQKVVWAALAFAVTLGGVLVIAPREDSAPMTLASAELSEKPDQPAQTTVAKATPVVPLTAVASSPAPAPSPVAVASEAVKAASVAAAAVARPAGACVFSSEPGPEVSPAAPKKEGKFVYLVSPTDMTLCVVDGNKQANALQLKAGEGRSVYGSSPWQISGSSLTQVQIYFQGWRASLPEGAVQKIVLVEKTLTP